ncbi:MAG TPA: lycopene cyclase family protein [Euzebya sp.]|nr:lycopene cyclase family protein [Euzebya sp.]
MPASPPPTDLLVVGGGPAGRALALRAVQAGLAATIVDPAPEAPWPATYGAWAQELPGWLPGAVVAATTDDVWAFARTEHRLPRRYLVLSNPALRTHLDDASVAVVTGQVFGRRRRGPVTQVVLHGGSTLDARVVVDASGAGRVLTGGPPPGRRAAQTAVGVVVSRADELPTMFMDWRADHGEEGWPTFLYAIPLGGDRLLLEETSLARRPGLDLATLRRRLDARLHARGITVPARPRVEHVGFLLDTPVTLGTGAVLAFGASAPLIHPATGYSLAASLALADPVAHALAEVLAGGGDGDQAAAAARRVVWSRRARLVHHLRQRGLEALLALPPVGVVDFFELFFSLDPATQHTYLFGRDDVPGVMSAMLALYRAADRPLRRHLMRHGGPLVAGRPAG